MRRYTTPTITLLVKGADLTQDSVYVTFQQRDATLTVEAPSMTYDGEDTTISVPLSQLQTGGFAVGSVDVQVNFINGTGKRNATSVKTIGVGRNLLAQVIDDA